MDAVWVVPVLAAVFGGFAIAALARGVAADARELAREVARFGELHQSVAGLRSELARTRSTTEDLRRR